MQQRHRRHDYDLPELYANPLHGSRPERANLLDMGIDVENGLVSRRIFSDPEIYAQEQERIFRRCWLFLAHESQVPKPGDYVTTRMADAAVIVCRDVHGHVNALLNSCRHRGNTVCGTDAGHARTFTCSYHGWAYDLQGKRVESGGLINVPGMRSFYNDKLEKDGWGLIPVAKVQSYRGLVFDTFDPNAPPLEEYLGDFRWAIDMIFERGNLTAAPGVVRWRMKCNWKFPADNSGDMAHAQVTHRSAFIAMSKLAGTRVAPVGTAQRGFTLLSKYGHMGNFQTASIEDDPAVRDAQKEGFKYSNTGVEYWRNRPETIAKTGEAGDWVIASSGWHEGQIAEGRMPTRHELDAVAPGNPVWIPRGGHVGVANSAALRVGGIIVRDAQGEPTGFLVEGPR